MLRGWFKLNRDIVKRAIFSDAELLRLYIYLKADAYYEPYEKLIDGKAVMLQPGQGTFGTRQLAAALGTNHSTTYKRLKKLEKLGFIAIEPHKDMSVYTIKKSEREQSEKVNAEETPQNQQPQELQGFEETESKQDGNEKYTQSKTLKEGRKRNNNNAQYDQEFEAWWAEYPRKLGKAKAKSKWSALRKDGISAEKLTTARDNYNAEIKSSGTQEKFIKHGSTFLNGGWQDYAEVKKELESARHTNQLDPALLALYKNSGD